MDTDNKTIIRLTEHMYIELEKKFPEPRVTDQTSATQAGYQLGVQAVLKALRIGYVISYN